MNIDSLSFLLAAASSESTESIGTVGTVCKIVGLICLALGLLVFIGGALGLVRFPDFYSRMHAAGKGDTLSTMLMIGGFALFHVHDVIVAIDHPDWHKPIILILKLAGICLFIMLTSPTSTHALMEAGYEDGIDPKVVKDELKEDQEKQAS